MKTVVVSPAQVLFGWPVYSTWNTIVYALSHHGWRAKTVALLSSLPVLILSIAGWAMAWAIVVWLLLLVARGLGAV